MSDEKLGFKTVTARNLLEPDPISASHHMRTVDGFRQMLPEDWVDPITGVTLPDSVPFEVRRAFQMARDAMCYGYWFYPLVTLMAQQLLRVADFATDVACLTHSIKSPRNFKARVDELIAVGIIPQAHEGLWEGIRRMRNHSTHPNFQQIWGPGMAIPIAQRVADAIAGIRWNNNANKTAT